jgi:LacI family transcriptional regulator
MNITIRKVAKELGVSVTTVSKVLNNHADIGGETRARVLAKVEELGYRPNAVARSLTLRRTHTLGVVVPDLMHSFFVEVVAAVEAITVERGFGLLLCMSGEDVAKERRQLEMLGQRQVDGILLASVHATGNTDVLAELMELNRGLVMFDRDDHPDVTCHRVLTDDERVGYLATSHLIALGHRAIAHLAGPAIKHAERRERGYRRAMQEHGLEVRDAWIASSGFMDRDGQAAMQHLLQTAPEVTAVFAVNDPAAIGAIKAVWNAGLRVPDDVAVIGAGDIAHGDLLRVPLTTVGWSRQDMGTQAAELVLDQIENHPGGPFRTVVIEPELIARASAGRPRAGR